MNTLSRLALISSASCLLLVACSDDDDTPGPTTATTTATTSTGGSGGDGGDGGDGGAGAAGGMGGMGGGAPTFATVAEFDAAQGQLAEGLAVTADTAYVGYAPLGTIVAVDLADGTVSDFANTPPIPADGGFLLGLAVDASDNLYAGLASFNVAVVPGIYRWAPEGGLAAVPWASDAAMGAPNGLAFDANENLFVADSSGTIFSIAPDATVTTWLSDPLLEGAADNCPNAVTPFDIGANGIVVDGNTVYVANTNLGSIVSIPVENDGSAGTPTVLAGPDCDTLGGADGLALSEGTLYVTLNGQNALAAVALDGTVTRIETGDSLQSPASAAFGGPNGNLYITNAAFAPNQTPGLIEVTFP